MLGYSQSSLRDGQNRATSLQKTEMRPEANGSRHWDCLWPWEQYGPRMTTVLKNPASSVERQWQQEARRRRDEVRSGTVKPITAAQIAA